ncbi:MAG: O-antigen ligase family protein [Vicinamibacterales bacterium]
MANRRVPREVAAWQPGLSDVLAAGAVSVLPGFMNLAAANVFEEEKSLLLCGLAAVLVAAAPWASWPRRPAPWIPALWVAFVASLAVASALSADLQTAVLGAYVRRHGLVSWAAATAVFLWLCQTCRHAEGRRYLVTAVAAGSVWPCVYAIAQAAGADPVSWAEFNAGRSGSTFGNPLLFGGYLVVCIPLTAMEIPRRRWLAVPLVLQLAALAATGSRGPALALGVGIVAGAVSAGWRAHRRLATAAVCLGALLAAGALALPAVRGPALRLVDPTRDSGMVRILIWRSVRDSLDPQSVRFWIGHGAESIRRVLVPHYSGQIARFEGSDALPDRAHNEMLDTLLQAGLLGVLLELCFYGAVLAGAQRVRDDTLRGGLTGAIVAHLAEAQLGIVTIPTRLTVLAAAALVVGLRHPPERPEASERRVWGVVLLPLAAALSPAIAVAARAILQGSSTGDAGVLNASLMRMVLTSAVVYAVIALAVAATVRVFRLHRTAPDLDRVRFWRPALGILVAIPVSLWPSAADVAAGAAGGLERGGHLRESAAAAELAVRLAPWQPAYRTTAGGVLMKGAPLLPETERAAAFERAEQFLREVNARRPGDPDAARNLASLLRVRARADAEGRETLLAEADRIYAGVTARTPGLAVAWAEWANVEAERRRFESAEAKLVRALDADDTRSDAWTLLGHVRVLRRRFDPALVAYERTLDLDTRNVAALRGRAALLAEMGRTGEALESVERLLAVEPGDTAGQSLRARLLQAGEAAARSMTTVPPAR